MTTKGKMEVNKKSGNKSGLVHHAPAVTRAATILRLLAEAQVGLGVSEIARRVGRDVRGVHTDVHSLLAVGLIERDEVGFRFPYDAVHVDFTLKAA